MVRLGVDVGGTFTDLVALHDDGRMEVRKVATTPEDPAVGLLRAVDGYRSSVVGNPPPVDALVHGTTVATNALLERRGARTALVTTEGFRDVLELRRMRMPHLYDYFWTKPEPLVPRHLRFEIAERMTVSGDVLKPLDDGVYRPPRRGMPGAGGHTIFRFDARKSGTTTLTFRYAQVGSGNQGPYQLCESHDRLVVFSL